MIFRLAIRNFVRQGIRAFLNVLISGLTIILTIFMLSLLNGFQAQAVRNLAKSDVGGGQYRLLGFDLLTPTEWEDFTFPVPGILKKHSDKVEVLIQQGQLFPNNRLYPVQLRGIEMAQKLLDLPLDSLRNYGRKLGDPIPTILGSKLAKKAHIKKGDTVILKWRDRHGAVEAREIEVLDVAGFINPRLNDGIVWMRLDHLRLLTQRTGEVSWVVVKKHLGKLKDIEFQSPTDLMKDLLTLLKHDRRNTKILWFILMFLASISIFNTQILNIFKRQKEIGMFMAMGMTPRQVIGVFTLEGGFAAIGALIVVIVIGIPFFTWFQSVGFDVSHLSETTIPIRERIFLDFNPDEIVSCLSVVVAMILLMAWWPVRKITRLDPTQALRGKAIV